MRVRLAIIVVGALVGGNVSGRAQQSASDAGLHLRVAQKAVEDSNFEIALSEVTIAATLAPTDAVIQFALATILDKVEKVDEALAALDKAQALNLPESFRERATDLRVTLLYKQQKNRQAAVVPPRPESPAAGGSTGPGDFGRARPGRGGGPTPMQATGPSSLPLAAPPPPGTVVSTKITNSDGKYSINVPSAGIIQFSLAGFKTVRYEASGSSGGNLDVMLPIAYRDGEVITRQLDRGSGNSVRGRVTDDVGGVVPGVTVTVFKR